MAKLKHKVNAKNFVRDYRAGKSDTELMDSYNLSRRGLDTLLKMLVDKRLLRSSELKPGGIFSSTEIQRASEFDRPDLRPRHGPMNEPGRDPVTDPPRTPAAPEAETRSPVDSSRCLQCNARVTERMLICPECGHVLPGEERWSKVEPKKRFLDRVPPKVLGTMVALPIAVAMVFVFKEIIIPMTENTIEKRAKASQNARSSKASDPGRVSRSVHIDPEKATDSMVERLIASKVLAHVNEDLTVFHVGSAWWLMSGDDRLQMLDGLRKVMTTSLGEFELELLDSSGGAVAWVNQDSVELYAD